MTGPKARRCRGGAYTRRPPVVYLSQSGLAMEEYVGVVLGQQDAAMLPRLFCASNLMAISHLA